MDILERLEASPLGAAARRLTYERPEPEPPDDMGVPPTVPASAEDVGASRRAPSAEPDSPDLVEMRRDLYSVTAQLGNLTDLMQAVYEQQQQQLQQNDRQTDRQTERTTDRQTEQMNDSQTRSPSATQKQNAEQYDKQQNDKQQYDQAIAAAVAAAAAVRVGVGVGVGDQQAGDNSEQGTASVCRQQEQEQQMTDGRQYDRAIAAAVAAAMSVGMDAQQTGDCSEQGTASAYILKCPASALQAVQWLEQYEGTTAAATGSTVEVNESAQNRGQRETDEWLYDDEWLYSSDDKDDDVRDLNTLRALHRMDLSGIGTGEDVGTKTGDCSRQQETPVQRSDILQDQNAQILQTEQQRETADEAAGNQSAATCGTQPEQGTADSEAKAVSVRDENAGAADGAERLKCLTAFRKEGEPPDDWTAAAAADDAAQAEADMAAAADVTAAADMTSADAAAAGRSKCMASIRREDEPPDWMAVAAVC